MLTSLFQKWIVISLKVSIFSIGGLAAIVLGGTFINMIAYRSFRPLILPIPSTSKIGQDYLQAVIHKKHNQVCDEALINQFGNVKTRNVSVSAEWLSGNSDHEFQVTTIQLEYRQQSNNPWQKGTIQLMTVSNIEGGNSFMAN